jgi:hypothetical protein
MAFPFSTSSKKQLFMLVNSSLVRVGNNCWVYLLAVAHTRRLFFHHGNDTFMQEYLDTLMLYPVAKVQLHPLGHCEIEALWFFVDQSCQCCESDDHSTNEAH